MLDGYTQRQVIALENPEQRDPQNWMATNNPFTREVRVVQRDKDNALQLVSILTVDLDSPPVWHARVGYLQPTGDDADYFVPIRMWTEDMSQLAHAEMARLVKLPREVERSVAGMRPAGRPTNIHCFVRLSPFERDWLQGVMSGGVPRSVELRYPEPVQ